jgi:hypothetical protein
MEPDVTAEDADRLDTLLRAIEELDPDAELPPGETQDTLDATARKLGRPLPVQLREIYRAVGGGASLVGGNLTLFPLIRRPGVRTTGPLVATARNALRSREWFVPDEVLPFATDGGGDVFGVWSPPSSRAVRPLVVLSGAGDGDEDVPSMAVVGEDPIAFFTGWIAHYVYPAHEDVAEEIQDELGLPVDLQGDPEEISRSVGQHLQAVLRWASPTLPDLTYDPDKGWPMSVEDVRELAATPLED